MKRLFQTIHTDLSKGIIGNCLQTCIACLTEIPIGNIPKYNRIERYHNFMNHHNMLIHETDGKPPIDNILYIAAYRVAGLRGIGHVVIYRNGRIIHDPKRPRVRLYRIFGYFEIRQFFQTTLNLPVNKEYDKPQRRAA